MALIASLTIIPSIAVVIVVLTRVERRLRVIAIFAAGYFAALPALLLESALRPANPIIRAFLVVALIEESTKLMLIAVAVRSAENSPNNIKSIDLTPFGVSAGMGIAAFENILGSDASAILIRSVTALPLHLSTGLIMASVINHNRNPKQFALALAAAVCVHGFYDLPLFVSETHRWLFVPIAFVLIIFCTVRLIRWYRFGPHSERTETTG